MKTFYFKKLNTQFGREYFVTAKSKDEAFFDLDNHIQQGGSYDDISYWREHPKLVVELKLGDIVETEIN